MIRIAEIGDLKTYSEVYLVRSIPIKIMREQLDQYLKFSKDSNPIHSPEISEHSVIPANLLISIIPSVLQSHIQFASHIQCYTVGYRNIRFRQSMGIEDDLRISIKVGKVKLKSGNAHVDYEFSYYVETGEKAPASGVMSDFYMPGPLSSEQ